MSTKTNKKSVPTNWTVVFNDKNGLSAIRKFVNGEIGFRNAIERVGSAARTELYRLEAAGVSVARKRTKDALNRFTAKKCIKTPVSV